MDRGGAFNGGKKIRGGASRFQVADTDMYHRDLGRIGRDHLDFGDGKRRTGQVHGEKVQ